MAKPVEKMQTTVSEVAREAPIMKSTCLTWQSQGQVWREAFVKLPAGMLAEDLLVPGTWKNIQQVPQTALQKFDRVTAVAHDESRIIRDVIVAAADHTGVWLSVRPGDRISLLRKV